MSEHAVVAIDGPAASGKSSVARGLARQLNYSYVSSGLLYRAVAWLAGLREVDPQRKQEVIALLGSAKFAAGLEEKELKIRVDGEDPLPQLQGNAVNRLVAMIAAIPEVRVFTFGHLQHLATLDSVVMEGRDIGTAVFPQTPFKFYIDASPAVRAQRRAAQGVQDNLLQRDQLDRTREIAPLVAAPDALVLDTSDMPVASVIETIRKRLWQMGLGAARPGSS